MARQAREIYLGIGWSGGSRNKVGYAFHCAKILYVISLNRNTRSRSNVRVFIFTLAYSWE